MNRPTFAVILSGCGVHDGSEIHEAVLALLAIDRAGAAYQCFAPDIAQHDVVNHLTGQPMAESRNALVESARIARGRIKPLAALDAAGFDGLLLPGGFGAAKTLSTFAADGGDCRVEPEVERAIRAMHAAGKPIGALCIAPAVLARVLPGAELTIGSDAGTAAAIEQMGGRHRTAGHGEVVVDRAARVATSPCYMLDASIGQIAEGAAAVVAAMMEMAGK
ncbi:isoprenoid biosynthesis glyoxalase ElbB [Magnetospirillum sp. UT-4]|uniref:isoprenoid biosynthesis glyoxalase ElbB n=1 Tax=Magnetospirillum sp. UT-4 TaxID=2681467 RepID=UPI001382E429|nr:isoprenoid biosynthesis glyoxalase ElbB [Magnetospirillum sp. UT-4]CAA7620034.1 isoprenoid biosynthesis protein with amidotransferase-like domain [Magnetospirillum sp. UT-4]